MRQRRAHYLPASIIQGLIKFFNRDFFCNSIFHSEVRNYISVQKLGSLSTTKNNPQGLVQGFDIYSCIYFTLE